MTNIGKKPASILAKLSKDSSKKMRKNVASNLLLYFSDLEGRLPDVRTGLWFDIKGDAIKASILKTVENVKSEMNATAKKNGIDLSKIKTDENGIPQFTERSDFTISIRDKLRKVQKLEAIARNLDITKTYRLSEYDLREYGL